MWRKGSSSKNCRQKDLGGRRCLEWKWEKPEKTARMDCKEAEGRWWPSQHPSSAGRVDWKRVTDAGAGEWNNLRNYPEKLSNYPASFGLVWGLILSHDNPMERERWTGKCPERKAADCVGDKVLCRSPSAKRSLKAPKFRWVLKLPKIQMNWIVAAIWPVCVPLAAPTLTACPIPCKHSVERLNKVEEKRRLWL